jgi:threonine/homoserine/homoserine lactone efflux protein
MQKGYTLKIVSINAIIFTINLFGFGPTVFYTMSNSHEQMRVFGLQGLVGFAIFFCISMAIAYAISRPVEEALE